ncbi:MAG: copper amine oxidase N-terminal domain-containing protein [Candidatus Eremiobacteraeota bacterium]|nr:copper amine oxidase N-terminal domain-containing protein [Candidatus Eremiobacteraeota bacterium]
MRALALLAACALLLGAAPASPKSAKIGIAINGERLAIDPPARLVAGHLLVPVRRIIEALGLDFVQDGKRIVTHAGYKTVTLQIGSRNADVDGDTIALDAAPVVIKDVLYAPLRFFTDVLGSQASFDPKARLVTVVAELIGRSGNGISKSAKRVEQVGTVTAIDVDSDPPTVTLSYNASIRTTPIAPNASIMLEDVNANVNVPGELTDVRPGDYAHLFGTSLAQADRVIDQFGSRVGTVAAVSGGQMVLADGHVIAPGRNTRVSINGTTAAIDDLHPGDSVAVRYNVATNEVREVLAGRALPQADVNNLIDSVATNATHPLRANDVLIVTLHGPPAGAAQFDVGPYVLGLAMSERTSGNYVGTYRIPNGANFADVPIIGHLRSGGGDYARQAPDTISASGSPPGIGDFAPAEGAVVNSSRPALYATFVSDAVPVNPSSVRIIVDGHDITSSSVRTARFVHYVPVVPYPDGVVHVTVKVADLAGNRTSKSWSFTIRAR